MAIYEVNAVVSLSAKDRSVLVQALGVSLSVDHGIFWTDEERGCIRRLIKEIGAVNDDNKREG